MIYPTRIFLCTYDTIPRSYTVNSKNFKNRAFVEKVGQTSGIKVKRQGQDHPLNTLVYGIVE